ncbi:hypothetical protein C8R26_10539 [Nitrosomonas oligotropha]|uniref:Uncharacterized protein n=1 Tax=Nitrosomonas oligotropha TaxID=42354 RepID=A0A2T5I274_9PROT|nr:hypothetical protein C8R26_10539 [Nitrosomonas oligotropha]
MDLNASDVILGETTFLKEISFFRKTAIGPNDEDIPVSHLKVLMNSFFKPNISNLGKLGGMSVDFLH